MMEENLKKLYNQKYRDFFKELNIGTSDSPVRDEEILKIGKEAEIKIGNKILEPGSGSGGVSRLLAKNFKVKILGVEFVKIQIKLAKDSLKKFSDGKLIKYKQNNIEKFHYPKETFDFAIDIFSWLYLLDTKSFLKKIHQSLKKGGKLIIYDVFLTEKIPKIQEEIIRKEEILNSDIQTIISMVNKIKETGFKIIKIKETRNQTMDNWNFGLRNVEEKKEELIKKFGNEFYEVQVKGIKNAIERLEKQESTSAIIIAQK